MTGESNALEPPDDCRLCPRLAEFRKANRQAFPGFFNRPVPSFGDRNARLLIVGLAPGLKGANRTGRPFTGDFAGDLLYGTLAAFGLSKGTFAADPDDGLTLVDCLLTNAVRCVPPENKPTGTESRTCRRHLTATIGSMPRLKVIFALGRIAHDNVLSALDAPRAEHAFAHGAAHRLANGLHLVDSYHCSRYNTNTGKLTAEMFRDAMGRAKGLMAA
ncbi:MAG: uracil-DNA glycosylase [Hyphomicrobiaceae bacterium]